MSQEQEDRYDEMLDECYEPVSIAGYTFTISSALRRLDPTAYRCGFVDWLDSEDEEEED